jgi:hypothetical protein
MKRLVLACLVAVLALGGCARSDERPAGVAESWLQEVAKQGRPGIRADAEKRAADLGDPAVARGLIPARPEPDEKYFSDLEVGRAALAGDGSKAQVPYRVTQRVIVNGKADTADKTGTLVLDRAGRGWKVVGATGPIPALKVPSQGGPLPARAKAGHWLTALLLGFALTAVSVAVVEAQPKRA